MLAKAVNDDTFVSLEGKSKHQLWLELCDIITRHPRDVTSMHVDAILRSGIRKFTDEVGRVVCVLQATSCTCMLGFNHRLLLKALQPCGSMWDWVHAHA